MATINLFGLTADLVRAHHFPQMDAWTSTGRPSSTVVTEKLNEEAGRLAGALNTQGIDAGSITVTTSPAYLSCRKQLRMMVALLVARDMLGTPAPIADTWEEQVNAWFEALREGGATALGDDTLQSSATDPNGPTSHLSVFGLTGDSSENMSTTIPHLRKDDSL
jgi:hypothetical protein